MQLAFPVMKSTLFFTSPSSNDTGETGLLSIFVPTNPFRALSEDSLLATVLFSLFLAIGLIGNVKSGPFIQQLSAIQGAFHRINDIIMRTVPPEILVITAKAFGTPSVESLAPLEVFITSMAAISLLFILMVLPLPLTVLAGFSYRAVLKTSSRAVVFGFSTRNDFLALPLIEKGTQGLSPTGQIWRRSSPTRRSWYPSPSPFLGWASSCPSSSSSS